MTTIRDLHRRWSRDADYKEKYEALGEEFDLARALIEARTAAGLSQSQLARRMRTSQSYVARIVPAYSNRVATAVAQPAPIRSSLTSRISMTERDANSSPLAPSSKAAVTFCDPTKTPLAL
jgi:predicted DNA-binding protein (UPF0251 family)